MTAFNGDNQCEVETRVHSVVKNCSLDGLYFFSKHEHGMESPNILIMQGKNLLLWFMGILTKMTQLT